MLLLDSANTQACSTLAMTGFTQPKVLIYSSFQMVPFASASNHRTVVAKGFLMIKWGKLLSFGDGTIHIFFAATIRSSKIIY